ncbi:MAG: type II toxin-antitoxin system VapC family toxin [Thermoanaerobaculia bacterium]
MRVLVDTHAMLWWLRDDTRLSGHAHAILKDGANELLWSIASSWEIAVKLRTGKLELGRPLERLYAELVTDQGVELLPIGHKHCARVAELPLHHRDPFDRMLVAQAQHERVPILTADPKLSAYDVELVW